MQTKQNKKKTKNKQTKKKKTRKKGTELPYDQAIVLLDRHLKKKKNIN